MAELHISISPIHHDKGHHKGRLHLASVAIDLLLLYLLLYYQSLL